MLTKDVNATAVTGVGGPGSILYPGVLESIQSRINLDYKINLRTHNQSIRDAIAAAIEDAISRARHRVGGSSQLPLPVVIQLDMPLDFIADDLVLIYKNTASPLGQSIYTEGVFTVSEALQSESDVTIAIHRIDASVTLKQVMEELSTNDIYLDKKKITDRLPAIGGTLWNSEPFTFRVEKNRCALVTTYESHPDQLVVVFGSPPAGAGGSKRKRVISRKLKSLNKKRKYTQRLTRRRRYYYKGGRKN